jgi:Putative adhesin
MRMIQRSVFVALALVVSPGAAAAQAPDWVHELADEIAVSVERQAEQLARFIEQRIEAQQARRGARGLGRGPEFTEPFSRTVRIGRNGTFDLQNVSGDIVVTGGGGDDVRLEATKRVRHPNESEARSILSAISIQVQERSGRVDVRTDYPRRRNWSGGVDFSVAVPRDTSVTLRSVSGTVRVTSVNGELRAESVSGDIVASSARRIRVAKTVSGNLEISDAEADDLVAGSVSGDVTVNKLGGSGVDAQTVSGDLRLTDVDVDHASLRSVSGDIVYSGRLARNGRYQFQSHSGDLRITPDDTRGFAVEATTFSGAVRSDYPLTLQGTPGAALGPRRRDRSVRGAFGDAGATLTLQSFSGDIAIVKQ